MRRTSSEVSRGLVIDDRDGAVRLGPGERGRLADIAGKRGAEHPRVLGEHCQFSEAVHADVLQPLCVDRVL